MSTGTDMYDMLKITLNKLRESSEISDSELGVLLTEINYAQKMGVQFDSHQIEYMHKGRWLTLEVGTAQEKDAIVEYERTTEEKRFVTAEPPVSRGKLMKIQHPEIYNRLRLKDRVFC